MYWGCIGDRLRGNKTDDKRDGVWVVWYGVCGLFGLVLTGLWVKEYYTRMKCGIEG